MPSVSQPYETLLSRWMVNRFIGAGGKAVKRLCKKANWIVLLDEDRAHELEFEVAGTIRGDYRFEFDHRHSAFTEKKLTVTVCAA